MYRPSAYMLSAMSTPTFKYRHSLTGQIAEMTEDAASAFPEYLQRVADDAKPYEPGLFKPGKVGEFDNPEPLTDAQLAAQAELEAALEEGSPRTKAAREAKAEKEAADKAAAEAAEKAAAEQEAAEKARAEADAAAAATNTEGTQS